MAPIVTEPTPEFVSGQVHALLAFALAIAKAFPDRPLLAAHFHAASQTGLAKIEPLLVSDDVARGFQTVSSQVSRALER